MIVDIGTFDESIGKSIVKSVIHEMTIIYEGKREKIEKDSSSSENEEMMWIAEDTCYYLLWILEESPPICWTGA